MIMNNVIKMVFGTFQSMVVKIIAVSIEEELVDEIDKERGPVSRSRYVRDLIAARRPTKVTIEAIKKK